MSKTQYTPGPWEWREGNRGEDDAILEPDVLSVCLSHGGGREPNEADALLIAAAPDLLTACENLVETIRNGTVYEVGEPMYYNGSIVHLFRDVENARAAIAKANR